VSVSDAPRLASPDWLLAAAEPVPGRFHFARVDRQSYQRSAFLDHRIQPRPTEVHSCTAAEADQVLAGMTTPPAGWILHTAFCCSTLLASCLDHPGVTLSLREPLVLSHLAAWRRQHVPADSQTVHQGVQRVLRLMDRTYPGERVVVKPSNFANALLPELLQGSPTRRIVLMSSGLRAFLVSILKKEEEAKNRLPVFLEALLQDSDYALRSGLTDVAELDLLQQGFLLWHCQRYAFQAALQSHPDRFYTLGMERFLQRPLESLQAVSDFLKLGLSQPMLEETVRRGAFRTHSKDTDRQYSADEQAQEKRTLETDYAAELASLLTWAQPMLSTLPVKPFAGED
jgi:hypothetical protein